MAFNSTNKIRSVVVGEFEDHISPETSRAQKRVATDMEKMAQSARGFIKAAIGIIAIREIKQIFTQLISFASEHQTAVTGQINKMKNAYNAFMTGLVESPLFQALIEKITDALNFVAVLLQDKEAWSALTDYMKAKWDVFAYYVSQSVKDLLALNVKILKAMATGGLSLILDEETVMDHSGINALIAKAEEAGKKFGTAFDKGLKSLKVSGTEPIFRETQSSITGLTRDVTKLIERFRELKFTTEAVDISAIPKELPVDLPTGPGSDFMAKKEDVFGNTMQDFMEIREQFQKMYSEDMPTFAQVASQTANIISGGLGGAFDSMGAAIARGQSAMGAFAKGMIAVAGQIAGSFGDMFIKLGMASLFINPAQGIALIAAGAALKVLAGFLGAKAGGGVTSSGSSGPSSPSRDYGSDRLSSGKAAGNIYVTVNVKNDMLDPSGYNEKRFNEVSYNIGKNFAEQIQRGRGNV